jgi:hypothetical protein
VAEYGLKAGQEFTYSVGQPMGALSSWAMLALTHHLIVQFCAFRVFGTSSTWFSGYEVLGDDIVIFDRSIYLEYLRVMSMLGVSCQPSKSIPAFNTASCEFAKRSSIGETDVSGLSWKEFLQGNNLPGKINLALRLGSRSLIGKESLLKAALIRFGSEMTSPVKPGLGHALIGILGSLIGKSDYLTLKTVIMLLVDPRYIEGEDYEPSKVTIPVNQAMRFIVKLFGREKVLLQELISSCEERENFAKSEILPFASQTAYLKALGVVKQTVQDYDKKITFLASAIIDCSRVKDAVLCAQIRSVAEDILLKDEDPQDFLDDFEMRIRKETCYKEPSLEWSLAMFKEATEFSMRFNYVFKSQQGVLPTDNALALIASRAGSKVPNYWFALEDFQGYTQLGLLEKDWLRAAKSTVTKPLSLSDRIDTRTTQSGIAPSSYPRQEGQAGSGVWRQVSLDSLGKL